MLNKYSDSEIFCNSLILVYLPLCMMFNKIRNNNDTIYFNILISLFAHIVYNPIEQQDILITQDYNYINNIEKTKKST